jgi:hypothetical protein
MSPEEFQFATAALEDIRKLIAAGKLQKWDVIKWAVTVNVALATAFIALLQHPGIGKWWYCALAGLVAFVAFALMLHYNDRLMNTRNDAKATYDYLLRNGIDVEQILGKPPVVATWYHDKQELIVFTFILLLSLLPVLIIIIGG